MIAHVLLFRPSADLAPSEREALVATFERALTNITSIRRAHIGRRRLVGRSYEQAMREDYPFIAMLEFDSERDLRTYLDHPAHAELAQRFFQVMKTALVYDFEMSDASRVREALLDGGTLLDGGSSDGRG
jgi:hypothetical protein